MCVCPQLFNFFRQIRRRDAQRVGLAGCVDVRQDQMIRMGKRFCKFMEEGFGAGVGMGLEYSPQFFVRVVFRSF